MKIIERPILPSSAAINTVHGVMLVIPNCLSYIIQINAIGNKIPAKLIRRKLFTITTTKKLLTIN